MNYEINHADKSITYNGTKHVMPRKEFMMFCYIKDKEGKIVSRQELLENIWEGVIVDERTIDVHLRRIRMRFPDVPIVTRRCFGYIWNNN